ncbi:MULTISPECIES: aldo/keto reductase [Bifidobacterium]|uniref:2,5-didehydrogluconate reductase n=1 Tax=Bifidobacterium [indicum] DSM 20214 = LMG 11587 TaxID=1341694 RepID=A0A087VTN6_9BIFI|nr:MULTISPECIES: aldo/keto reductase [Bifidobacterium]AIC91745.1 2,5-didehydrogluconate reductase [Bifidobacterium indicum LMG 11587 = DSM 20214]MBH9978990.1 aldo/keto reductase [Bifidobacterium sp. W8108]MBI0173139.1 aldo/keto reductase [Bifidobacterium sp. M0307]
MTENVTDTTLTMNNGVQIPQLGLGVFQTPDGKATSQAVTWALQAGYRHIDTAMIYGNEESVGQGLRDSGLKRRDVFLTTKLWNDDIRSGRAKEAFEESLDRLGTDYVDLYLIHWPAQGWQQAWQDMEELYRQRRVRAIGVCNFQQHHLEELHSISSTKPAVNQIESSPQFVNQELIDYCHGELRIDVEAYSPLGGTGGSVLSDPRLESISRKVGRSPAQVVLRWHIQRGLVVIPKSTHQERIEQNAQVFDFTLDEDDMKAISAMDSGIRAGADPDNFDF